MEIQILQRETKLTFVLINFEQIITIRIGLSLNIF